MLFIIRRSFSLVDFFAKKWNTVRLIGNPLFIIMKKRGNTIEDKENNNRMDRLNLSDNIIRFRRERKITQEELADFLGVSKAAVSKWLFENVLTGSYGQRRLYSTEMNILTVSMHGLKPFHWEKWLQEAGNSLFRICRKH
nr:helix-turn-helix transcriptional regulator [uncultured Schaedlerella sp.]